MSRWIGFIITILLGIGLGLFYGWVVNPVEYVDTTPASLRSDYQADYVLMVAEIYQAEGDPALAAGRLAFLGGVSPLEAITTALQFGEEHGYTQTDLGKLDDVYDGLLAWMDAAP